MREARQQSVTPYVPTAVNTKILVFGYGVPYILVITNVSYGHAFTL